MRLLVPGIVVCLLCINLAVSAVAAPFDDGLAAYDLGDYATALRVWRPLAELGDAAAESNLGLRYDHGQGVSQDHATAPHWYRMAADQGDAPAEFNLALQYDCGG